MAGRALAALPRLDLLINNAGSAATEPRLNEDGLELTFMVNHVAPFILTLGLLDLLQAAPQARVLNVNSGAHWAGRLDPERTPYGHDFGPFRTYAASKLANALFTVELAERLAGTSVTVNAFHPGMFDTPVFRSAVARGTLGSLLGLVMKPFMTPRRLAGDAAAWLATDPALTDVTGQFFDRRQRARFAPSAADAELRQLWWEKTAQLAEIPLPTKPTRDAP